MLPHQQFSALLTSIAGADLVERLKLINEHDRIRKHGGGILAGDQWLINEAEKHNSPLHHVLTVVQDETARRIIQSAIQHNDTKKMKWLESRLHEQMVGAAAQYIGLDEDKIREQAQTPLERRRLRFKVKQSISTINLSVGATGGKNGFALCTPFELAMRETQKKKQAEWAAETYIYCQELQKIASMSDIMKSAGQKRVAEILANAKGLQDFGEKHNLVPVFYTLTAPSRMHPNPTIGKNSWDGTLPREAQAWIHGKHRSAFQILRDEEIYPAGIRTVEGHADECPHWHCIAWLKAEDQARFEKVFRGVAPSWKNKKGCDIKNMLDEPEDGKSKAKAISYIFKYILKSIGGLGEEDEIDGELAESIKRQDCWRAKHGIRGYQTFGLPSLGLWRNLRAAPDAINDNLLEKARCAANDGRGCDFIEAAGGLNLKRKERPISVRIEKSEETGKYAIFENRLNGFICEQQLKKWEIINDKQRQEIETELQEKYNSLTVVENHPSEATPHTSESEKAARWGKFLDGIGQIDIDGLVFGAE